MLIKKHTVKFSWVLIKGILIFLVVVTMKCALNVSEERIYITNYIFFNFYIIKIRPGNSFIQLYC